LEGFALVELVAAPASLQSITLELAGASMGSNGTAFGSQDMSNPGGANDQGINDPALMTLRTRPAIVPASSGPYPYLIATL
ncbi:hypothetical protein, partial [Enterococcus sp. HPCN18]|uniref:hypothetical protein n=1 Tax=Enterococcus sp. HPCN18 TaxID=2248751 RepID=UPI0015EB66CD